jgi:S4 domain
VFGQAELAQLDRRTWAAVAKELPLVTYQPGIGVTNATHGGPALATLNQIPSPSEQVVSGGAASTFSMAGPTVASVMVSAGSAPTLSAARRAIAEGGVYLNNHRVTEDQVLTPDDLFHDRYASVRRGKRTVVVFEWRMPSEAGADSTDAADHAESGGRPEAH